MGELGARPGERPFQNAVTNKPGENSRLPVSVFFGLRERIGLHGLPGLVCHAVTFACWFFLFKPWG